MNGVDPVLIRGLQAVAPYLDDLVVAGGWVPYIYGLLDDAGKAGRSPRTRDIDLAVARSVPIRGVRIDRALEDAGFECRFHSLDTPAVTKYVAVDANHGCGEIEIEFITDAPGDREAVVTVQPGLTAQELHYVGIMLDNPWPIDFGELTNGAFAYRVQVPTPGAFVLHKALVFKKRSDPMKREKDLYYIFFVFDGFPDWRPSLEAQLRRLANQNPVWFGKAVGNLKGAFAASESAGVEALVRQRPQTAYSALNDDQFGQYAFSSISELISTMDAAR